MNREQRERHEQGETDHTNFRAFRGENYNGHAVLLKSLSLKRRKPRKRDGSLRLRSKELRNTSVRGENLLGTLPFFVRGFRAFRGENYSGHSLLIL